MEPIKVMHKIKLGFTSNLLILSLAGAIVLDASVRALDYAEKQKLVKIGKGLEKMCELTKEMDKTKTDKEEKTDE